MSAAEQPRLLLAEQPRRLLGLLLLEMGVITEEQLEQALAAQEESGERLGEVLIARGFTSRLAIQDALAQQSGFLLEPERGYGTGLRAKLVESETRLESPIADAQAPSREGETAPQAWELVEPSAVYPRPKLRLDELEQAGQELERLRLELAERAQRLGELERALDRERSRRAAAEAGLDAIERAGQELRRRVGPPERLENEADASPADEFLAVVERAPKHLAARRAQLRQRRDPAVHSRKFAASAG